MMILYASLLREQKKLCYQAFSSNKEDLNDALFDCLTRCCHDFDIEVPMWQEKHTKQLLKFRKVTFLPGDFIDETHFDQFVVEVNTDGSF